RIGRIFVSGMMLLTPGPPGWLPGAGPPGRGHPDDAPESDDPAAGCSAKLAVNVAGFDPRSSERGIVRDAAPHRRPQVRLAASRRKVPPCHDRIDRNWARPAQARS